MNPGNLIFTGFLSQLKPVQIAALRAGGAICRLLSFFVSLASDDLATRVE